MATSTGRPGPAAPATTARSSRLRRAGPRPFCTSFAKTGTDGQTPYAGLIQGSDGNFYGTTYFGGANGFGTVFKVTPSGTETVLYSFAGGSDGEHPYAGVIQGSDGNFYGTTYQGGTGGYGTVFKLTPSGTETVLYTFAGGSYRRRKSRGRRDPGQRRQFLWKHPARRRERPRHRLQAHAERDRDHFALLRRAAATAQIPGANLLQGSDGNLYGSTAAGGASGDGTFFKVTLQ